MKVNEEPIIIAEIPVGAAELVEKAKELMEDEGIRRLIVRRDTGEALIEVPLTAGIETRTTLTSPVLAALGAIAALITDFRIQVEREPDHTGDKTSEPPQVRSEGDG